MSGRRLAATVVVMALAAAVLGALTPDVPQLRAAVVAPQRLTDVAGPDALVLAWTALLGWAVWAWGALGLALTAASAVPGVVGAAARLAVRLLLPAAARRSAALALGVGLGLTAPLLSSPVLQTVSPAPAAAMAQLAGGPATAPDWPTAGSAAAPATAPDWPPGSAPAPTTAAPAQHVVVPGDCLWDIAAMDLRQRTGAEPSDADVVLAVRAWADRNADVIGADPDLLFPGEVLTPPDRTDPESTR